MVEKVKTEEVRETFWAWPSKITGVLASMPLSLKLGLLVLITLLPRVLASLQPHIITMDGTLYIKMAKEFADGKYGGTPGSYFSLYPFLIFLIEKLVGEWELSGQLISITLGTLTVIPVFLLGRSLYNEKIGWLSAIFYITLPNLLKFDSQVIREPTLWFFILFTMWFVWEGEKKNRLPLFALASLSAGFAAVTRVEGFIIWAALGLHIAFKKVKEIPVKKKFLNLSLFILIFPLLFSVTFCAFNRSSSSRMAFGEMTSFSLKFIKVHTQTILRPQDPIDTMGEKTYYGLPMISQDSLELASRHRFPLAVSEVIYKFLKSANLLLILIFLGLWKRKREEFGFSDRYLLYIFMVLFLMSVFYARQLYYFSTRHGLTLVLPSLFFAGHGLDFVVGAISKGLSRFGLRGGFISRYVPYILMVLLVVLFLAQGMSGQGREKAVIQEIGTWLKENGFQGSLIMGPKKFLRLAFYADGRFVEMPDSWEKAIESIRKNGVRVVVIDSCTTQQDCPAFLESWSKVALVQLKTPKKEEENCAIQIYMVP